jgi:hypothetical protein
LLKGHPADFYRGFLDALKGNELPPKTEDDDEARSAACASPLPLTVAEGTTHTHVNAVRSPELLRSYS